MRTFLTCPSSIGGFLLAVILGGMAGADEFIKTEYHEIEPECSSWSAATAVHGAVGTFVHPIPGIAGGPHWGHEGNIKETQKGGGAKDKLDISGKVQHKTKPPGAAHVGEPEPNPNKLPFHIAVEAGVGELAGDPAEVKLLPFVMKKVKHKNHWDSLLVAGSAKVNAAADEIDNYVIDFIARHSAEDPGEGFECALAPRGLPSNMFGAAALLIIASTGRFGASIGELGVPLAQILQAQIRLGTPDSPGSVIFSFNPASFTDANGMGATGVFADETFPAIHIGALFAGGTFLEIVTAGGSLAGQLVPIPVADVPAITDGGVIALAVLLVATAMRALRWRSAHRISVHP